MAVRIDQLAQRRTSYVPLRCQGTPNCVLDRAFGIHVCMQRDTRCAFHGPVHILDQDGRHFECRMREAEAERATRD